MKMIKGILVMISMVVLSIGWGFAQDNQTSKDCENDITDSRGK